LSLRPSAARQWPPLARFVAIEERWGNAATARGPWTAGLYEFLRFGVKQAWACLFGGIMLALIVGTWLLYPRDAFLSRYDFLTIAAIATQVLLLRLGLETREEAKVILLFHVTGTVMEIFKTSVGSWIYPEESLLRIAGVPLFTGFMYAAIGSYIARAWRLFDFRFTRHPPFPATAALCIAIYANFYTHHYMADLRLVLFAAAALLFGRSWVHFRVWRSYRRMPLLLGLTLVALFIWFAENIGTFTGAWLYPSQHAGWSVVPFAKLGSWFLLMLISYVMVTAINRPRALVLAEARGAAARSDGMA
jgi:uncharacterized membrane protein YoaT (DUF817 family)